MTARERIEKYLKPVAGWEADLESLFFPAGYTEAEFVERLLDDFEFDIETYTREDSEL